MDGSVLEKRSSFKMLGLSYSFKMDWGSYIISIAGTVSKKIGALIRSMKFFSPKIALDLYNLPCGLEWHTSYLGCYSRLLLENIRGATKAQIYRTIGPSFVAFLNPWLIIEM